MINVAKNNTYIITREQYKKIKKYDHAQMDSWIRNFAKNLNEDNSESSSKVMKEIEDIHNLSILEALENTKGIGEKIRVSFLDNYNKALIKNTNKTNDNN